MRLIEARFDGADDLLERYLEHAQFPVQLAQLSELASGCDPSARRFLADLVAHLEGGDQ